MPFIQRKIAKSFNQTRNIFDVYAYETDDTRAQVLTANYFIESRFNTDPKWIGSHIEVYASDGYMRIRMTSAGSAELLLDDTGASFDPQTEIAIERLYDGESLIAAQEPSALDTAQYIQFGVVQGTASDPIQTIAQGGDTEASILRINTSGTYRIKTAIQYGRTGASGTSILNFRVTINGVQAGRSINQRLENANQTTLFTDEAWVNIPAGSDLVYEVIRDSNGNNSGGLIAGITSGSTGWNSAPSCAVRVERWVKTP